MRSLIFLSSFYSSPNIFSLFLLLLLLFFFLHLPVKPHPHFLFWCSKPPKLIPPWEHHSPSPSQPRAVAADLSSSFPLKLLVLFLISNLTNSFFSHLTINHISPLSYFKSFFPFFFHFSYIFLLSLLVFTMAETLSSFSVYTCRNP